MSNKFILKLSAIVLLCLSSAPIAASEITGWNLHVPNYPVSVAMDHFGKLVAERTEGRIKPVTLHDGELGNQEEAIKKVQFGNIDFAVFNMVPINSAVPSTQVITMPYAFRSLEHMHGVVDGPVGAELFDDMRNANLIGLSWFDGGARSFYASKPIKSVADLSGLRIRMQSSPISEAMIEALDATLQNVPFKQVQAAFEEGKIDAAENNLASYESAGHYKVAPYYLLDEHSIVPEVFVVNRTLWDSWSRQDKAIVQGAALEAAALQRDLWAERRQKAKEAAIAGGAQIVELDDKSEFVGAMSSVYSKFMGDPRLLQLLGKIQQAE